MEIEITHLMNRADEMHYYSASAAELGNDAGQITWHNACDNYDPENPDGDELLCVNHDAMVDWFAGFGAWSRDELDRMSDVELNALLLQFIAGDIRSVCEHDAKDEARIYQCESDGTWWFYLGD